MICWCAVAACPVCVILVDALVALSRFHPLSGFMADQIVSFGCCVPHCPPGGAKFGT